MMDGGAKVKRRLHPEWRLGSRITWEGRNRYGQGRYDWEFRLKMA